MSVTDMDLGLGMGLDMDIDMDMGMSMDMGHGHGSLRGAQVGRKKRQAVMWKWKAEELGVLVSGFGFQSSVFF